MLVPTVINWFDEPASNVKPVGVEDLGDGNTPLGSSKVTLIAHDEPPVESTAKAICGGVACQFATFHGDEPELDRVEVLNEFVRSRNGWITSVPGDVDVTIECLPGSSLPDELRAQGYDLVATGNGERIVATAIMERFCTGADGELEPLTSGSTRAVAQVVTHAGIVKVKRYCFETV